MLKKPFPFYRQPDVMDCGPACLRMVARHFGRSYSIQTLRERSFVDREGVSLLGISDAAESIGFHTLSAKISFESLSREVPLPCIAHWRQDHFVVVYQIKGDTVFVADPAHGKVSFSKEEFLEAWAGDQTNGQEKGVVLILEPTPDFHLQEGEKHSTQKGLGFLFRYLFKYKKLLSQLLLGLFLGSILQLIFPFLTQALVDYGIGTRNIGFIYLILAAQLMVFISRAAVEFIRGWILLHISTRINISIISDFLIKLMKLPMGFFDTKMTGDLLQRIQDHHRIETFLTHTSLNTLFSVVNLLVFGIVLIIYNVPIFLIFILGSILYIGWLFLFLRRRRELDFKSFDKLAANQSSLIQLITGMQEIKLNNIERTKRWGWERIQASLFRINLKRLALSQYQEAGSGFINELKNILIIFYAASEVIDGGMTLGMMLAVSYIIGQMNQPVMQLIGFIQSAQDAGISLERLNEIHSRPDEEPEEEGRISLMPDDKSLRVENLSFRYGSPHAEKALDDISLKIPEGKVTALVGTSGSGKTTLIKLLLKFYEPLSGEIRVGDLSLKNIRNAHWRGICGAVMQDGFLFSDTIANNIALEDPVDTSRLLKAVKIANIQAFVESLPLGYNSKIGPEGSGLSQGQKQRILIARAVYKDPEILFFDEATNALDANNEKVILENLRNFFKGRTVLIVAHRLSTVKHADQIIVLEKGKVVETGTHAELSSLGGAYYTLVKNQLELGN